MVIGLVFPELVTTMFSRHLVSLNRQSGLAQEYLEKAPSSINKTVLSAVVLAVQDVT